MNRSIATSGPVLALSLGLAMAIIITASLGAQALEQHAIRETTQHQLEHIELASAGSALVHALQRERGMSFGRAGSTDNHFDIALEHQRTLTDARIAQWSANAAPFLAASPRLDDASDRLGGLEEIRGDINDRLLPANLILAYYTELNLALLSHINHLKTTANHPMTTRGLTSWYSLAMVKDLGGLERALVAHAYAANTMEGPMFQRYMQILEKKYAYLDVFRANATPKVLEQSENVLSSQVIDAVQKERLWVMKNAGLPNALNRDPSAWFELMSRRVDAFERLETVVVEELEAQVEQRRAHAAHLEHRYVLGTGAGGALMTVLLVCLIRRIGAAQRLCPIPSNHRSAQ